MKTILWVILWAGLTLTAQADPWVDDWLNQMTVTHPGYFEGQRRGYFTGGGFQARWRMRNDHLMSAQPPRIRAGCGGIDLFLGGLSFLDPDLLVQKLQRILQAAPAVAFDMAMKTLCKECSDTMMKMHQTASWLNSLQLNECAMSKRLVTTVKANDPDVLGAMWSEISSGASLGQALERNWKDHQDKVRANQGQAPNPMNTAVQDCPAEFRDIFTEGSVIENATRRVGLEAYQDIIRGYLGDVVVTYADTMYQATPIDKCRGNRVDDFDDLLTGHAQQRPATGGPCTRNHTQNLYDWVGTRLQAIADKLRTRAAGGFTVEEQAFIDAAPLPVLQIMKTGVMSANETSTIAVFREPLATAYAFRVMDDLLSAMDYVLRKTDRLSQTGPVPGGDPDRCNVKLLQVPIQTIRELREEIRPLRRAARLAYDARIATLAQHIQIARGELAARQRIENAALEQLKSP